MGWIADQGAMSTYAMKGYVTRNWAICCPPFVMEAVSLASLSAFVYIKTEINNISHNLDKEEIVLVTIWSGTKPMIRKIRI